MNIRGVQSNEVMVRNGGRVEGGNSKVGKGLFFFFVSLR
jgi:hypothetical protein